MSALSDSPSSVHSRVTILAPAKLNLGLEILGRRPDGYHEVVTLLQAIRLTDRIDLELLPEPEVHLAIHPPGLDLGPVESNLAVRAAALVPPLRGQPPGLRIGLTKRIPHGAGLGGGSADAAAVLIGLGLLRRGTYIPEALEEMGAVLGMDVPFFIRGGTQLGTVRGERLRPAPPWPGKHIVVVHPNRSLSTASIYARANWGLTSPGPLSSIGSRGFPGDFWPRHGSRLRNDLEATVLAEEPSVGAVLRILRELGSPTARVTGSGSAVFGEAPDRDIADAWTRQMRAAGFWARHVRPARGGCRIRNQR